MKKLFYSFLLLQFFLLLSGFGHLQARCCPTYPTASSTFFADSIPTLQGADPGVQACAFRQAPIGNHHCCPHPDIKAVDFEEEIEEDKLDTVRNCDSHTLFALILRATTFRFQTCSGKTYQLSDTIYSYWPSPRYLVYQDFRL